MSDPGETTNSGATNESAPESESVALDAAQLYDRSPCALMSTTADGVILRVNRTFVEWTGYPAASLVGEKFVSLLDRGSTLFYETRYFPALRLRGSLSEVALDLRREDGEIIQVLLNAVSEVQPDGSSIIHGALFDTSDRRDYERQLLHARREAEAAHVRVLALQEASARFGECEADNELASSLARSAREAFSATAATVVLFDGESRAPSSFGDPRFVDLVPLDAQEETATFSADDPGPVGNALGAARLAMMTTTPLRDGGTELGVLACFFARPHTVDAGYEELQRSLARQAVQNLTRLRLRDKLEILALYDPLTGLANRNLLRSRIAAAIPASAAHHRPLALFFVDLDGFKEINDKLDHAAGDTVLRDAAHRLRRAVRDEDVVGRYGGDEFIVLCEDADGGTASRIAERIRTSIAERIDVGGEERHITASIGVAVHEPDRSNGRVPTANDLVIAADAAMYESKRTGKNRTTVVSL